MSDVVIPLRLVVIFAAIDGHGERLAVGREGKSAGRRHRALRKERVGSTVGLGCRVEAAPLDVGTKHETHLVADVARHCGDTFDRKRRRVRPFRERQGEDEGCLLAHAAGNRELPASETSRRIGREARHTLLVQLARITLALQPAACARPEVQAVGWHGRIRVRREEGVVLRADLAPADAHLRRGACAVGEDRPAVRCATDLLAGERESHLRLARRRRHKKARAHLLGPTVPIDGHVQVQGATPPAIAVVVWRVEDGVVGIVRTPNADRLAGLGIDEPHAETGRCRHFDQLPFRNDDIALCIARHDDVEKWRSGILSASRRGGVALVLKRKGFRFSTCA